MYSRCSWLHRVDVPRGHGCHVDAGLPEQGACCVDVPRGHGCTIGFYICQLILLELSFLRDFRTDRRFTTIGGGTRIEAKQTLL
jgi:hypothetical protein